MAREFGDVAEHPRAAMLRDLERSGLTAADAKKLKLEVLTSEETYAATDKFRARSVKFPYLDRKGRDTGYFRLRFLDQVRGIGQKKPQRYWQAAETLPRAYLPPKPDWDLVLSDPLKELWVTEGEKKAAAACKAGIHCVGLGGVWSWRSAKQRVALVPDLATINWQNREVVLCFDSDADPKPEVSGALVALARALEQRGAKVKTVQLPLPDSADKCGLDDFLVEQTVKDLLALPREGLAAEAALLKLNEELAVIDEPSAVLRLSTGQLFQDPTRLASLHYGHLRVPTVDASGRLGDANAVLEWLKWPHRRTHSGIAYEPGQPKSLPDGRVNLWSGWPREPKKGSVKPFLELLDYQLKGAPPEHRRWFEQWMAYPVRHPGEKLYAAVVLWSQRQGTGKTLLAYTLGRVYGPAFGVVTESELHGAFNDWQFGKQLVLGEEITGAERWTEANRLKHTVTGETVRVNRKYQATFEVRNCVNFLFTTNHHDAFMLERHDRRYFVREAGSGDAPPDLAWFRAYDAWYRTETAAAALHYWLLNVDLKGFNPKGPAPETAERAAMVESSSNEADLLVRQLVQAPDSVLRIGDTSSTRDLYTLVELVAILDPDRRARLTQVQLMKAARRAGMPRLEPTRTSRGTLNLWAVRNMDRWAKASHAERAGHYDAAGMAPTKDAF